MICLNYFTRNLAKKSTSHVGVGPVHIYNLILTLREYIPIYFRWMIRPEHAWPAISKFLQAHLPIGVLFAAIFGPVGSHYCLTLIHVETLDACTQDPPDSIGLPRTTRRNPIFVTYRNSRQRCNAFSGVPFTMSSKIVIITIFLDLGAPSLLSLAISTLDALLCSCISA